MGSPISTSHPPFPSSSSPLSLTGFTHRNAALAANPSSCTGHPRPAHDRSPSCTLRCSPTNARLWPVSVGWVVLTAEKLRDEFRTDVNTADCVACSGRSWERRRSSWRRVDLEACCPNRYLLDGVEWSRGFRSTRGGLETGEYSEMFPDLCSLISKMRQYIGQAMLRGAVR